MNTPLGDAAQELADADLEYKQLEYKLRQNAQRRDSALWEFRRLSGVAHEEWSSEKAAAAIVKALREY